MTTRTFLITTVLIASTVTTFAQTPAPRAATPRSSTPAADTAAPPPPPPAPPVAGGTMLAPRRPAQPVNVKIEFTLTDLRAGGPPVKRTLSVTVADAHTGQIRSQSEVVNFEHRAAQHRYDTGAAGGRQIRVGFNLP